MGKAQLYIVYQSLLVYCKHTKLLWMYSLSLSISSILLTFLYPIYIKMTKVFKVISRQYEIEQEKGPLIIIKIQPSSEYNSESNTSTDFSLLLLYISLSSILLLLLLVIPSLINSPLLYNISQYNQIKQVLFQLRQ